MPYKPTENDLRLREILEENVLRNLEGKKTEIVNTIPEIRYLIEQGVDVQSCYYVAPGGVIKEYIKRPLHLAVQTENTVIVDLLLQSGASINSKSKGECPLHVACDQNSLLMVKHLLQSGADVNVVDGNGCTPLHTAVNTERYDIAKFLVENNAKVDIANKIGYTAENLAAEKGGDFLELFPIKRRKLHSSLTGAYVGVGSAAMIAFMTDKPNDSSLVTDAIDISLCGAGIGVASLSSAYVSSIVCDSTFFSKKNESKKTRQRKRAISSGLLTGLVMICVDRALTTKKSANDSLSASFILAAISGLCSGVASYIVDQTLDKNQTASVRLHR